MLKHFVIGVLGCAILSGCMSRSSSSESKDVLPRPAAGTKVASLGTERFTVAYEAQREAAYRTAGKPGAKLNVRRILPRDANADLLPCASTLIYFLMLTTSTVGANEGLPEKNPKTISLSSEYPGTYLVGINKVLKNDRNEFGEYKSFLRELSFEQIPTTCDEYKKLEQDLQNTPAPWTEDPSTVDFSAYVGLLQGKGDDMHLLVCGLAPSVNKKFPCDLDLAPVKPTIIKH
jgi:hypothetical protein